MSCHSSIRVGGLPRLSPCPAADRVPSRIGCCRVRFAEQTLDARRERDATAQPRRGLWRPVARVDGNHAGPYVEVAVGWVIVAGRTAVRLDRRLVDRQLEDRGALQLLAG